MRLWVTLLAIALGLVVSFSVFYASSDHLPPAPAAPTAVTDPPEAPAISTTDATSAAPDKPVVAESVTAPTTIAPPPVATSKPVEAVDATPQAGNLHVLPATSTINPAIGSDDPTTGFKMRVDLYRWGAGIELCTLADYAQEVDEPDKYILAGKIEAGKRTVYPYAALSIAVNGHVFDLRRESWSADAITGDVASSATFRLIIGDENDNPVLEIVRRFLLQPDSYELQLEQQLINRSGQELNVVWRQYAQGDVVDDGSVYLGDRRQFVSGYFAPKDPAHVKIYADTKAFLGRVAVIKDYVGAQEDRLPPPGVWPLPKNAGSELVWLASTNRYFTVVTHPALSDAMTATGDIPALEKMFPDVVTTVFPDYNQWSAATPEQRAVVLELGSNSITIPAGQSTNLDIGIYVGPRQRKTFSAFHDDILQLDQLVRYELGCIWCTFQWLARGLLAFLTFLHDWVVFDWGMAIIILVACVRLLLHPITRRAQINMMKMGKQMQTLQPEMEKLKKKYADDQTKLNQETMKLYREKGVNPANMLGCLPMFLQMPIWIALYAMLYLAIELRHQPAFYGVFQNITGGKWQFLASLSSPDQCIRILDEPAVVSFFLTFDYSSINILPLLMGVVFFIQQKFTMPPAATEQARQQQKMMKFMVLLFPVFLYSAPSGLTLYIMASTTAGILDSYLVRKHVKEQEEAGTLFDKKPPKPGGFMARMQKTLEEKQQQMDGKNKSAGRTGSQRKKRKKT